MTNSNFNKVWNNNIKMLEMYVPVVRKVHGPTHKEFYEVANIFDNISKKVSNNDTNLNSDFQLLREITKNYLIPSDVCETYEAVYNMLKDIDATYMKGA